MRHDGDTATETRAKGVGNGIDGIGNCKMLVGRRFGETTSLRIFFSWYTPL